MEDYFIMDDSGPYYQNQRVNLRKNMWKLITLVYLFYLGQSIIGPSYFDDLIKTKEHPFFASKMTLDTTVKNNNLEVYLLTKLNHTDPQQLTLKGIQAIVITSYMHARQPYSVELVYKLFEYVLRNGYESSLGCFLKRGVIIFYPFVNIDGFHAYVKASENQKKMMRKNMNGDQKQCRTGIAGVDINRNFPSDFGTVRESSFPCGEEYHGKGPFSQSEAKVLKDIFAMFKVVMAVDVHSYGNQWIYPYASDATDSKLKKRDNYPIYHSVIQKLKKNNRTILSCWESLRYVADGVYIDWAADQGALSLAYEVGVNFNHDFNINDEIQKSLTDFGLIFDVMFPQTNNCAEQRVKNRIKEKQQHPYKSDKVSFLIVAAVILFFTILFWGLYFISPRGN